MIGCSCHTYRVQEQKFYENSNLKGSTSLSLDNVSLTVLSLDDIKFMRVLCSEDWDGTKPQVDHDSTYQNFPLAYNIRPSKFKLHKQ